MTTGPVHQFTTGAVRSTDADDVRYDLISPIALEEIARTYKEGADKYGDANWLAGMPVSDLLNHAIRHVYMFLSGDRSEPHLPHAAWGLMAAIHSHKQWPHLNGNLLGPGCVPPPPRDEPEATPATAGGPCDGCIAPPICAEWGCELRGCEVRPVDTPAAAASAGGPCDGCPIPNTCEFFAECLAPPVPKPHRIPRLDDPRDGSVPPPVLYLSGPMSGIEAFNFPAFNEAAEKLRRMGFPVLNPADFGWGESDWAKNLARDLGMLGYAEILVQLPGWDTSRGASLEYNTAISLGKGVASLGEILDLA